MPSDPDAQPLTVGRRGSHFQQHRQDPGTHRLALVADLAGALILLALAGSSLNDTHEVFRKTTIVIQLISFVYRLVSLTKLDNVIAPT